MFISALIVVAC